MGGFKRKVQCAMLFNMSRCEKQKTKAGNKILIDLSDLVLISNLNGLTVQQKQKDWPGSSSTIWRHCMWEILKG